ncbi:MAG: aldehyde ferredoxin oxidoreductase family protein, partial [Candidatus Bathyarchaeia archaeon]
FLLVDAGKVSFEDARTLRGLATSETEAILKEKYPGSQVACIGPAGENLAYMAAVFSDTRAAGRGGMGAIMGAKNVKAIVARGKGGIALANGEAYRRMIRKVRFTIENDPKTGKNDSLATFGTSAIVHAVRNADMLPAMNFQDRTQTFEEVEQFSGEFVRQNYFAGRKGCYLCPTACGRRVKVDGEISKGPEYESVVMLGANAGFHNYAKEILPASKLCDELGLDTISVGNACGVARARSLIGSIEDELRLIREIAAGKSVFSKGVISAARELGFEHEAMHVKGLELPAYDPRAAKGIALAYATSNRGACHLRAYTVAPEVFSDPEYLDPMAEEGKAKLVVNMQDSYAIYDSVIACKYHSLALFKTLEFELDDMAKTLTAATGFDFNRDVLKEAGARINTVERAFNSREGFSTKDDQLPGRLEVDLQNMLEEYYQLRGWNKDGTCSF